MVSRSFDATVNFARDCIPLYETMTIAAKIPITTITISSSTMVNPDVLRTVCTT